METCCRIFFWRDKPLQREQFVPSAEVCLEPLTEMKFADEIFCRKEDSTLISAWQPMLALCLNKTGKG